MQRYIATLLLLILLTGCAPKTPTLLAEWDITGYTYNDLVWSQDSKVFAVNYSVEGNEPTSLDYFVQAFSVESLESIWVAKDSKAWNLAFTPNESLLAETSVMSGHGTLYLRDMQQGNIIRQLEARNCGGGWAARSNPSKNTLLVADTNRFIGLNADNLAFINQWDLKTGQCQEVVQYYGSFDIFDVNANGNLLAYGGEGKDDAVVIWDIEKRTEICRTDEVDTGRFIPKQNVLAVIRDQKMIFLDAISCEKLNELPVSTEGNYLAFSPDGQQFVIAADTIELREVATGELVSQIPYPQNTFLFDNNFSSGEIKFSPDGHYLLIALGTESDYCVKIQLWQLQ